MNFTELAGQIFAHADEQGTVSCALKEVFMQLREEAEKKTPLGMKVRAILTALKNKDDPFYDEKEMIEILQFKQMAHTALKMIDLDASLDDGE